MKLYNGTPHPVSIIDNAEYNKEIRKYTTNDPHVVYSIPSDGMLSAKVSTVEAEPVNGIPVYKKEFAGVDILPDGYDVYIVSAMYASAARQTGADVSKLFTVADPVYSEDGRTILGSRGICPFI